MKIYPNLTIVVAMTHSRIFGDAATNTLPWKARLPGDLPWFKRWTTGGHLIVGRRTWESLPGLLPHRGISVVTSKPETLEAISGSSIQASGRYIFADGGSASVGRVCHSAIGALNEIDPDTPVFAAGGSGIYQRLLPHAQSMLVTWVGDRHLREGIDPVYFPTSCWGRWDSEFDMMDEENELQFCVYRRSGV